MAELETSTALLKEALDELRTSSTLSASTILKLGKATKDLKKGLDESSDAIEKETEGRGELYKTFKQFTKELFSATQAVRDNREDFRSLKPAVDAFGTAAKYAASASADAVKATGEMISGLSTFLGPKGKLVGTIVGGLTSVAGDIMKQYGQEAVEFAQAYGKFALDEVQRVSGAFREMANVGGLAGGSIDQFAADARALGMSMDQYAKMVGRNSEGLAAVGTTVSQGAKVMRNITTAGTEFEDKFLKLGFSFEQQSEFSAKFLATQRNTNRINLEDTKKLSEANRKYLEQIDELARLTGQSRDKVANELEAMSRELRFGATLAIAEEKGTRKAIENTALMLEKQGSKELAEGFKDIFGGATTERSQALMVATNNRAAAIAEDLENGKINEIQAMQQLQAAIRETRNALGANEFERRVGKLGTVLDPMLVGMRRMAVAQEFNTKTLGKAAEEQQQDAEATGENIDNLVKAQKSLRDFATQIDEIVMKQLFPTMSKNVQQLIDVLSAGSKKLAEILGVRTTGGAVAPPPQVTGGGVNQRRREQGLPELPPEAAEREAGRQQVENEMRRRNENRQRRRQGLPPLAPGGGAPTAPQAPGAGEPPGGIAPRGAGGGEPRLSRISSKTGQSASVDERYAGAFQSLINYLDSNGYEIKSLGGYNPRNTATGARSFHAMGAAIDINPATNPMGAQLVTDMPADIGQIARSFGLGWGGDWTSKKDAMHFSAAASEGGSLLQAATGGVLSGPKSGYHAMLHGTEAVVPLPGGRSIPVEMTGMTEKIGEQVALMGQQLSRFDQMIDLLQSSQYTQQKIYRATVG